MDISYITGDATAPVGEGQRIIVHVCNDIGGWGRGFVGAISKRWREPEALYRQWYRDGGDPPFELGSVQFVRVSEDLQVANLIGQHGIRRGSRGAAPIRYEAVRAGLRTIATEASRISASLHMPRIGCGLAGGSWDEIEPIIQSEVLSQSVPVTVYDFSGARL